MNWMLLDIEGTTTPISFVYDCLFPYAREHLVSFVQSHFDELAVKEFAAIAREQGRPFSPDAAGLAAEALAQMDEDRKSGCLKLLQGQIWESGYQSGQLQSEVFPDVPEAFARWKQEGRGIAIYSSGSVQAQKLLFAHTRYGDLRSSLSDYFDTGVGPKREPESYTRIAKKLGTSPEHILFATDIGEEAHAAVQAGLRTVILQRPGNVPVEVDFPTARDFATL
jgi:enolase-phosphatase E1